MFISLSIDEKGRAKCGKKGVNTFTHKQCFSRASAGPKSHVKWMKILSFMASTLNILSK